MHVTAHISNSPRSGFARNLLLVSEDNEEIQHAERSSIALAGQHLRCRRLLAVQAHALHPSSSLYLALPARPCSIDQEERGAGGDQSKRKSYLIRSADHLRHLLRHHRLLPADLLQLGQLAKHFAE